MYQVIASNQFGKDYRKCLKRNLDIALLDEVIIAISDNKTLPPKFKLHKLAGAYKNCWECHIRPDWLLIWKVDEKEKIIQLVRTGTHSDLFE
ncbi:MAG: type toxin-antitoxin system mRNA interferase toxin, RelE/StbE family [Flavipsychrobacter sp.]|jgi:mRNA interferase YafQ|nr:type toxin-antitoxin system mRNA interferase toxin, RelE/StbE family [Flavipsychrobacter sp.]